MSGEKCARPTVLENLRRLAEERRRAHEDALKARADLEALQAQAAKMDCVVTAPPAEAPANLDTAGLRRLIEALQATAAVQASEIVKAEAMARIAIAREAAERKRVSDLGAEVARQVSGLSADVPAAVVQEIQRLGEAALAAGDESAAATAMLRLRSRVRLAEAEAEDTADQRAEAQAAIHELRGLSGAEVDQVREMLDAVIAGRRALTDDLRDRLERATAAAVEASENLAIRDALVAAFAEAGMTVREPMKTAFGDGGEIRVAAPGLPGYEMVMERDGAVMRSYPVATDGGPVPIHVDEPLCELVQDAWERAERHGVEIVLLTQEFPGQAAAAAPQAQARRRSKAAPSSAVRARERTTE